MGTVGTGICLDAIPALDILDFVPFSCMIVDELGHVVYLNPAGRTQFPDHDNPIGRFCYELVHPGSERLDSCPLDDARATGQPAEKEMYDEATDSWYLSAVTPFSLPESQDEGSGEYFFFTFVDITEEMRRTQESSRVNRALRVVSASNQALLRAQNEEGLMREVCRVAVEVGDFPMAWVGKAEKGPEKRVTPLAWAGRNEGFLEEVEVTWASDVRGQGVTGRAIRTGKPAVSHTVEEQTAEPWRERLVAAGHRSFASFPLVIEGEIFGALSLYADEPDFFGEGEMSILEELAGDLAFGFVSLRTHAGRHEAEKALGESEEQLRRSQKLEAVGRLAGGVAHDFNNMLTAMMGYLDLALTETPRESTCAGDIVEARAAAERAQALTSRLLVFSRFHPARSRVLLLNDVVAGMDHLLRRAVGEDVELNIHLAPDLWAVASDPGQLEQVMLNLIVNARDAMPSGGTIAVETANATLDREVTSLNPDLSPGPYVVLTVSDTGTGMDEETVDKIFDPFFTTKEEGKGTGLGLSAVYGLVRQGGGGVDVTSRVGEGTTFRLYFPRSDKDIDWPEKDKEIDRPLSGDGHGERILVVEDEDAVRSLVRRVLESRGYEVETASSSREALEKAKGGEPPDLLLTDLGLPGMGGGTLAEKFHVAYPAVNILYMSGYARGSEDAERREGEHALGTVDFLEKPFTPAALVLKVREALDA